MFSKPNALVYVHRSGLILYGKHIPQVRLAFPPEQAINLEIPNTRAFAQLCQDFFAGHNVRRTRALVVLDYSVVFEKKVALDKSGQPDTLSEAFEAAIPFEAAQRAHLTVHSPDLLRLFATNKDIYQPIVDALQAAGVAKVVAVVPIALYDLAGTKQTVSALAEALFNDGGLRKRADFTTA
jgi:hypothetical protein